MFLQIVAFVSHFLQLVNSFFFFFYQMQHSLWGLGDLPRKHFLLGE